jgi:holo-[acyl-carrier protein] synthase
MMVPPGLFVLGLGSDLCNITRIQNSIDRFGDRFLDRVFTDIERAKADRRVLTRTATFAKRFAAKEACSKALGTGFRAGVFMRDMGVVNLPSGAPTLALAGGAAARLAEITPAGHKAAIHLTITDDHPWAQAIVLITASPL